MTDSLEQRTDTAENVIDSIDIDNANDMLRDCHSELITRRTDQQVIDDANAKLERIEEITHEINAAWQDIIDIFKNATKDFEDQPTEQGGR